MFLQEKIKKFRIVNNFNPQKKKKLHDVFVEGSFQHKSHKAK